MMSEHTHHVLFLSCRNSARSILAEAALDKQGKGRFKGHSAAVASAGKVDPHVIELLESSGLAMPSARPKHYSEFTQPDGPVVDSFSRSATPLPESRCPNGRACR
jgi:arsenate reductase